MAEHVDETTGEITDDGEPLSRCAMCGELATTAAHRAECSGRRRGRRARQLTAEEQAIKEERARKKDMTLRLLELLSPSGADPGDPPVRDYGGLQPIATIKGTPLLRLPRLSGTGGSGSALVLRAKEYDGSTGAEPYDYVLLYIEGFDGNAHKIRTRGVVVRDSDVDAVIETLTAWRDGRRAKGNDDG